MVWDVDPEIFRIGPLAIRWYSLSFIIGFMLAYRYMIMIFTRNNWENVEEVVSSLFVHIFMGNIIGARLGHCLLYEPAVYLAEPWKILMIWKGGLASHGGFMGVAIATFLFARKHGQISFFWIVDRVAPPALLTGALIRVGNLFNSEIIGRPSDVPWAITFKRIDMLPRHPTQLYEACLYFIIAITGFLALEKFRNKWANGAFLGFILIFGMSARLFVEFFKENQVSFEESLTLNMGQMLSIPFILMGVYLMTGRQNNNPLLRSLTQVFPKRDQSEPSQKNGPKNSKKPKRKKRK